MEDNLLLNIVRVCLMMDELAIKIYGNLAKKTKHGELKKFWNHMSQEESNHVTCWKELLKLVEDRVIPQIFHKPEETLKGLRQNYNKIITLSEQSTSRKNITDSFVLGFRLEFYLLHPALERLWHFYGIIQQDKYNPEQEYDHHVQEFILAMREFGANTIELEALAETVERMWFNAKSMAHEASFDELTGILNRRGLFNSMTSLAYLSKRNQFNAAIIMIDIDHFKRINDALGHQEGDTVLTKVAGIIKSCLRVSDIFGRFGGEEFVVFLPQVEKESVFSIAEKIRKAVEEETRHETAVTISLGCSSISITGDVEDQLHRLIKQADQYLYEAKRKGRNQVIC